MTQEDQIIKDSVLGGGYVSAEDIAEAEKAVEGGQAISLDQYLFDHELINKDILGQAIAETFGVPYSDLNSNVPSKEQVLRIPKDLAQKYKVVIFKEDQNTIIISTNDPRQAGLLESLQAFLASQNIDKKIIISYSLTEDIMAAFIHYRERLDVRFIDIMKKEKRVAPEIIDEIFEDAVLYRVSDVHFEPEETEILVRFRIDGALREVGRVPKEYYENILNRIKVQAHLRIDDHFSAQDGALRYTTKDGETVDARISIMPTLDGEKIVIRVLSEYVRSFKLADLGLSPQDQDTMLRGAAKPFGMILVTGPTGSGKTTTLYALLKIINDPESNITTIEDPVEYKITGINQVQVNTRTNLTFANGLRSIVRQDPDIILVGEIRDRETAEIAVNAALTGHLLFSTFHANDAATAIPRLLDMGVEPFLMASTLEVIVAQRLVRRICDVCRVSATVDPKILRDNLNLDKYISEGITLYKGKGCNNCAGTGYKGRIGIFEFIHVTKEMQDLILKNPSTNQIWDLARSQGSRSMFEDGILKVKAGVTTIEELLRVAEPPENQEKKKRASA